MSIKEIIWDVEDALEEMELMRPVYEAMRKNGCTRDEAVAALKWIKKVEDKHKGVAK